MRSVFDNVVSASISLKPELFLILRILESGYDLLNFITILYYYFINGGARRDRTDDLLLAKQALSQLSYTPSEKFSKLRAIYWWARVDLNYRPHAYQACALTRLSYGP